MYPQTAVVILNWKDEIATANALESLRKADLCGAQIIVIDNGSDDGSEKRVKERFPEVDLVKLHENKGYAGGCNAGIDRALALGCDAIFIMNDDVIVAPDFLIPLLQRCLDQTVGIVGGKIYSPDEPVRFQSCGAFINFWTGETQSRFEGQIDEGQADCEFEPDYLSGAAFLITRRLIETVGGFEDRYFMYYEETDLCMRAQAVGLKVLYVPESKVWHCERSRIGSPRQSLRQYYMLRNRIIFMRKHVRFPKILVFWCYLFFYHLPKEMLRSLLGRAGTVRRVLKAVGKGLTFPIG